MVRVRFFAVLSFFYLIGFSQAQDQAPIEGFWLGPVDPDGNQSTIQIYPCGDKYCGRVSAVTLETQHTY